jgi:Inner membrane protein CreD
MKATHLIASLAIVACTAVAWLILGSAMSQRTADFSAAMGKEVSGVWGPPIVQKHPEAWFDTPNAPGGRARVLPSSSKVTVDLASEPKRRGLLWHRTYEARFAGDYVFTNPTKIPQTFYISFPLPQETAGLHGFRCRIGDQEDDAAGAPAASGLVTRAVLLPALGSVTLRTAYAARGTDTWSYAFPDNRRIAGFVLAMKTNFPEINFPVGTGSPSRRSGDAGGFRLEWDYPDVLAAPAIGMDMPQQLNAGPVAARIAFFAPVSLLFFVTVVLLVGGMRGIPLHPMHVFFVAAGFFAFHLLFAYLVDLLPAIPAFAIAAVASVSLVCGYLRAVGGNGLFRIALAAQIIYLVAFSASFFIHGLTGITLSVLGVVTLALLMFLTARIDWIKRLERKPPPIPAASA